VTDLIIGRHCSFTRHEHHLQAASLKRRIIAGQC